MTKSEQSSHLHDDERIPRTTRTTPQGMLELADKLARIAARGTNHADNKTIARGAAALRLSASPAGYGGQVCPKCKGAKEIEYEITYHGERNERVRDKCNGCGGTGVILTPAVAPDGAREASIEQIMFEIYKYGYQNRRDWPEERMWDDFKATRGSIFWDNAKRPAEAIAALALPAVVGIEGREAIIEECAMVADRASESDFEYVAKYPDEGMKYENRGFRANTIALSIRRLARHPRQPVEDKRCATLSKALADVRQELWVDYCLDMGRTDTDPRPFDSKPHIRIIDAALAHPLEPATDAEVKPYYSDDPDCIPGN